MPRAPSYNPNQVGPVQTADARFRAPDNVGAVGIALAEGAAKWGKALQQLAVDNDARQQVVDDAESRTGTLQWQEENAQTVTEALNARGLNAQTAIKQAEKNLVESRDEILSKASSPRAKALIRQRTDALLSGFKLQFADHAAKEVRSASEGALKAEADKARDEAVRLWDRPDASQSMLKIGREATIRLAQSMGRSQEEAAQDAFDYESGLHRTTFASIAATGDWDAAIAYHDAHKDRLNADDTVAVASDVKTVNERRQTASDALAAIGAGVPVARIPVSGSFSPPVANGRVTSAFGTARVSGRHNGVDYAAPVGTAVTPIAPGRVVSVSSDPRSGKFVVVDHGDGLTSSYSHLGRQDVKVGDAVTGSTPLGVVGMTGRTTGPHVHNVVKRHGVPIDPVSVMGSKVSEGGQTAASWDKSAAYAWIDSQKGWQFERKERAREEVDRQFARKDAADARAEREADEAATRLVLRLGDGFTSIVQIPSELRNAMSAGALSSLIDGAKRNASGKSVEADGPDVTRLLLMRELEPEKFKRENLGALVGKMTPAELQQLAVDQARLLKPSSNAGKPFDPSGGIREAINYGMNFGGVKLNDKAKVKVATYMASVLRDIHEKRPLTGADYTAAFNSAVRTTGSHGYMKADVLTDIPDAFRDKVMRNWKGQTPPTEDQIVTLYRRSLGG